MHTAAHGPGFFVTRTDKDEEELRILVVGCSNIICSFKELFKNFQATQ